jgi:GT2 family glycosyltransferase
MNESKKIIASLVLYNNNPQVISQLLLSIKNTPLDIKLFVVDNSPTSDISIIFSDIKHAEYHHNPSNPGFGASHNVAIIT